MVVVRLILAGGGCVFLYYRTLLTDAVRDPQVRGPVRSVHWLISLPLDRLFGIVLPLVSHTTRVLFYVRCPYLYSGVSFRHT